MLASLKYNKSCGQYCTTNPFAIASYLSKILTVNWAGQNTTLTMKFKVEPGIVPENLNETQADALEAKNGNVYVGYDNGTSFLEQGTSFSGQFTDLVVGADWLSSAVQVNVFNLFLATLKVPQTDPDVRDPRCRGGGVRSGRHQRLSRARTVEPGRLRHPAAR